MQYDMRFQSPTRERLPEVLIPAAINTLDTYLLMLLLMDIPLHRIVFTLECLYQSAWKDKEAFITAMRLITFSVMHEEVLPESRHKDIFQDITSIMGKSYDVHQYKVE